MEHKDELDAAVIHDRDFEFDYFGFKTLEKSPTSSRSTGRSPSGPSTCSCASPSASTWTTSSASLETYNLLSDRYFTHATPTLFNAGTPNPQMSSAASSRCVKEDSASTGFTTPSRTAPSFQQVRGGDRACPSPTSGLQPVLHPGDQRDLQRHRAHAPRSYNNTARYVDQGGGKRKGSIAAYIEPWHADIFAFLDLRKNHGNEMERARDLFYALWIPDLFMERVQSERGLDAHVPQRVPGTRGHPRGGRSSRPSTRSTRAEGKGRKTIKAQQLWFAILDSARWRRGRRTCCTRTTATASRIRRTWERSSAPTSARRSWSTRAPDEIAVCNLASPSRSRKFVTASADVRFGGEGSFDLDKLVEAVSKDGDPKNLNRVIDRNFYPVEEARKSSNMRHRPIGIGVQGLADAFQMMKLPFESETAQKL